jgi:plastocyanin
VQAGQSVGWYADYDCTPHNITFEDEPMQPASSGTLPEDDFYNYHRRTFTTAGVYRYRCTLHSTDFQNGEVGVVTVE